MVINNFSLNLLEAPKENRRSFVDYLLFHVEQDYKKNYSYFKKALAQRNRALKKEGKRLYEYARAGETPKITPRTINISAFEITRLKLPEIDFKIKCGKGTYIRSVAHDFGKALNSGAHLSSLKRIQSGKHHIDNAFQILNQ